MRHSSPTKHRSRQVISLSVTFFMYLSMLPLIPSMPASRASIKPEAVVDEQEPDIPVIAPGSAYRQANLVSDSPGLGLVQDPLLVNPWGIAATGSSPLWVANNGTSTSTLYRGDVGGSPLTRNPGLGFITIPGGLPTGTVANTGGATDFVVSSGAASGRAAFLFASITGNITGWNPNVPAAGSTTAVNASSHPGHVYTGLATGNVGPNNYLYAADFANGRIDVFDKDFNLQLPASFPFLDPTIPNAPGNVYHPFNIQNTSGFLYVAYAKVGPDGRDEEGVGNGFVRRFNADGTRDLTFAINNGPLNSPWGIVVAPPLFGVFSGALLIGNFGEGNPSIHAFNPTTGAFLGTLQNEAGVGITIDELWALRFGNGGNGGDPNTLYFAAGVGEEEHGLFGSLKPTTSSATSLVQFTDTNYAISEASGHIDITVARLGNVSGSATVNYSTFDESQPNHASQKSDYEISAGKLTFSPGETSKTFRILLVNDKFDEGNETVNLFLSNPTGAGVGIGSPNAAELSIIDDDSGAPLTNPIDDPAFFVRQQYLDFLNREPDLAGFNFWVNQLVACGGDAACIEVARVNISAAFFLSIEFQRTGVTAYLANKAAFNAVPLYGRFQIETQQLQKDFVFGAPNADAVLEANKIAYFNDFVNRPEFVAAYSGLTNAQYVDALLANAAITPGQVRLFIVQLTNSQEVPPAVPTSSGGGPRPASFGTARLQFNAAQTAMTFSATVNNIDFTGTQSPTEANDNLTAAHIHAGPAVMPGVNGSVVWGFFGAPFNDNNPNDRVVTPFVSGVGGTITGKWDAPEGNGTTLAAQLTNLRTGHAYVNFHTAQFGGGEVRGNIPAENAFRDSLINGLNAATETRATVLRKITENEEFRQLEINRAFVLMEYFGYLRRDPDAAGFNFWLNKLNAFNGDAVAAEMVKAFLTSLEYRQRFGAS